MADLDERDLLILEMLQQDAKAPLSQLSSRIRIPQTTVHNRIKRLEKLGVIKNYTIKVDYRKLGKPICAYVLINIDYDMHDELVSKFREMPFIDRMVIITGANDVVIRIRAKDPDELSKVVLKDLRVKGVKKTETMLVLEDLK